MKRFLTIFLMIMLGGPFVGHLAFAGGVIVVPPLAMLFDLHVSGADCPDLHYAGYSVGQSIGNALHWLAVGLPFAYGLGIVQAAWTGLVVASVDVFRHEVSVPAALLSAAVPAVVVMYMLGANKIFSAPMCSFKLLYSIGIPSIHFIAAFVNARLADALLKESET